MADNRLATGDSLAEELDQQDPGSDGEQREVEPELVVARNRSSITTHERSIKQGEVHAGQEHEQRDDPL